MTVPFHCRILVIFAVFWLWPGGAGPTAAAAQPAAAAAARTISGVVVDAETLAPLAGAIVSAGTAHATTDANGRFSLRVVAGQIDVTATADGHFALTTTLDLRDVDVTAAELSLAPDAGFATSVAVVAAAPLAAPAADTVQPVQVLRTPGALDNVYRTLQTLPGVAATEEFGSRLSVRGGSPDQNLTMMDGVEVHDPYRLFGLTSAFNPETLERFELAIGGFGAKYGDRLSSLLLVENRDGRAGQGLSGSASLSITDANVVFEGGLPKGARGSWLVTGRRTYYDLVAARLTNQDFPGFADVQARGTWAPSAGTRVTLFSLTSRQNAALAIDNQDARGEFQDDTDNDLAWLRVDASIGTRGQSRTTVAFSDTRSAFGVDASFQNTSQRSNAPDDDAIGTANVVFERGLGVKDVSLRQELVWGLGTHVVESGFEAHQLATSQRFQISGDRNPAAVNGSSVQGGAGLPELLASSRSATRSGAWLQDTWQMAARVSLQGGLRLDHAGVTGDTLLSPRLSGTIAPTTTTRLIVAAGLYTQSPGDEKLAQSDYVLDFTSPEAAALKSERAWQTSIGLEREFGGGVSLKVEGYYKRFTDVLLGRLEPEAERLARVARYDFPATLRSSIPTAALITTVPTNDGRGRSYGFDVFLNRPGGGRLTGWASYTWGKAAREAYGREYPFEYDRRHAFTMVSSFALTSRWDVAATTRIATGFPRTAPLGVRVAGREDALDLDGDGNTDEILPAVDRRGLLEYAVDFGGVTNLNGARLPVFARVDGRLTWRPRGSAGRWELYAEVINVLNRKNAGALDPQLAYDATADRPAIVEVRDQAIPRLPTIGVRFRF
ncbi:MAG TPA: TonB-dependent receptor [Vicinamibacterales bacterium]|nr:TonB-dependent receptor [Vicinamibacterales bacterium]